MEIETDVRKILELIEKKKFDEFKQTLLSMPLDELIELVKQLQPEPAALVFRFLPKQLAANVWTELEVEQQEDLLLTLSDEHLASLLENMAPDDRTQLLEELPGQVVQRLVELLSPVQRAIANNLMGYPVDSIGRLMTPKYIRVEPSWTVERAIRHIRKYYRSAETANVIYVVENGLTLVDELKLPQIVAAEPEQLIEELMDRDFVALRAEDDQETAINTFDKFHRLALPVVDRDNILLGIVTVDDIMEVAEEETTEDFHKIGGLEALDEPYVTTPFWTLMRKRVGWLMILFIGEMLTATAMGKFENEIASAVILALFVPLIISSGGNSGSQAATLVIRALAVGEITVKDWWRVMRREIFSGLVLGTALGTVGFLRISLWSMFTDIYGPHWFLLAVTIFFSLIGVVLWGTFSGSTLPLLLRRIGLDPAVSSAPFVATLVDVTGIVIYFSVAAVILKGTLL